MRTYPTDEEIQAVIAANPGMTRIQAVQLIRRNEKPVTEIATAVVKAAKKSAAKLPKAAKPKAVKKARAKTSIPAVSKEIVKADREVLLDFIKAELRKVHKKVCPILGILGQRFTMPSKKYGYPYIRALVQTPDNNLVTVFLSNFYGTGEPQCSVSTADRKSPSVKACLARIERRTKRAADKLADRDTNKDTK